MPEITRRAVPFSGLLSRTGPATCGQWDFWRRMWSPGEASFADMTCGGQLPGALTLDRVLAGIAALVERHESLRTRFRLDTDGMLVQEVAGAGEIEVEIIAFDTFEELHEAVRDQRPMSADGTYDPAADLPFRARVGTLEGTPVSYELWLVHLAADFLSSRVLAGDLIGLLADAGPAEPRGVQPIDKAERERTPKGMQSLDSALEHWRRSLAAAPRSMFPAAPSVPESPRYWRGGITSRALSPALDELARRYGVAPTHVLLAATSALLGRYTGLDRCAVRLMAGNRILPELRNSVGNLAQEVLTVVDLTGSSFRDIVRATWAASIRAQRHGQFDADRAAALVADSGVDLGVCFNDLWTPTRTGATAPGATPAETTFVWEKQIKQASVTFFLEVFPVLDDPCAVRLSLLGDTAHIPPATIQAFLSGIERLVLTLVERDLPMDEIEAPLRTLTTARSGRI